MEKYTPKEILLFTQKDINNKIMTVNEIKNRNNEYSYINKQINNTLKIDDVEKKLIFKK